MNENVPLESLVEPEQLVFVLELKPVFVPYFFVKVVGDPPVGVNVPVSVRTTQCVLFTHAD